MFRSHEKWRWNDKIPSDNIYNNFINTFNWHAEWLSLVDDILFGPMILFHKSVEEL